MPCSYDSMSDPDDYDEDWLPEYDEEEEWPWYEEDESEDDKYDIMKSYGNRECS